MIERGGDLWDFHAIGAWVAITTNGIVRQDGTAVMGRGVAYEAAQRYPWLARSFGLRLRDGGNHVHAFWDIRLFTFPVKAHWRDRADLGLIEQSASELVDFVADLERFRGPQRVYLVRPGCGNGGLRWAEVQPRLAPILDDRFIVVERPPR